jgi:hypothetical protein
LQTESERYSAAIPSILCCTKWMTHWHLLLKPGNSSILIICGMFLVQKCRAITCQTSPTAKRRLTNFFALKLWSRLDMNTQLTLQDHPFVPGWLNCMANMPPPAKVDLVASLLPGLSPGLAPAGLDLLKPVPPCLRLDDTGHSDKDAAI